MARRKKRIKRELLDRTDHRLDMSPVGRNLFVSRDKQEEHRSARRIQIWMRIVLVLVILAVLAAAALFVMFYLAPWFHAEISVSTAVTPAPVSSELTSEAVLEYDSVGLPVYSEEICLFAVNRDSPAQRDFVPELAEVGGVQVDARIAPALRLLVSVAASEGVTLTFTEGYVSYTQQEQRFSAVVRELMDAKGLSTVMARSEAASLQPMPGQSDFQSGMCVRLAGDPEKFGETREYSWLKANMGRYGFIFRYPEEKEDATGVGHDLTVLRYVGGASALAMQQRSMCLEEYINYLDSQ